jgi:glycosyltransferase involved in cell wall biosynthesis
MRTLFLNDMGFQYGAGIAHLRQVQSFLLQGHDVAAFCWSRGREEERAAFGPGEPPAGWRGVREFADLKPSENVSEARVVDTLVRAAVAQRPDVVVVGNLHAAAWPLSLLSALQSAGLRVVVFMHDCYLISGRCAYPGDCRLFETGCDETCPTAEEYPALAPDRIPAAWRLRRELLCGPRGIALAANSDWTLGMARRSLPGLRHAAVLYYGLDERLFREIDRALARRLLGIPRDAFVVAAGAVTLHDRRKGGQLLSEVITALSQDAFFVMFGYGTPDRPNVMPLGLLRDFRKMPLLYSAADVFLGTSLEEAFGQTFCEAAACSRPAVAFRVGGIPEVARDGVNAELRRELGRAGRALVEEQFTLRRQGERWMKYLETLPA